MSKGRLLLIDDAPDITALMLRSRGYSVSIALDGMEGIEKAKEENPDLVLLDVMMPGIDGYETCAILKSEADTEHIPVIMLTARDEHESVARCFKLGAADYIAKPFDLPVLLTKLGKFIGK